MNVEMFVLADFAQDTANKMTVVGTFDTLGVQQFPAIHPIMSIALRMRFAVYELGKHQISLTFRDQDGKDLVPPFLLGIDVRSIGNDSAVHDHALHLAGLRFEKAGNYRITLHVDGEEKTWLPLYVRQGPPPRP
jgi:hypothetical protein